MTRVTVWNEFRHEKDNPAVRRVYPDGIHAVLAEALHAAGLDEVRTATLDEPSQGLPPAVLEATEVLVWWGHRAHGEVDGRAGRCGAATGARRHGPGRPAFRSFLEDLQAPDGHALHPEMA